MIGQNTNEPIQVQIELQESTDFDNTKESDRDLNYDECKPGTSCNNLTTLSLGNGENEMTCQPQDESGRSACIPGKWVNFVDTNSSPLMNVQVMINENIVNALVHTGAATSLISDRLVEELGLSLSPLSGNVEVIGEENVNIVGMVSLPVKIDGIPIVASKFFVVSSNLKIFSNCVLGVNFLRANGIRVCPQKRIIVKCVKDGGEIEFHLNEAGHSSRVLYCNFSCYASKDVKLEPGKVTPITVAFSVPFASPDHLIMYSDNGIDSGLRDKISGFSGITNNSNKVVLLSSSASTPVNIK